MELIHVIGLFIALIEKHNHGFLKKFLKCRKYQICKVKRQKVCYLQKSEGLTHDVDSIIRCSIWWVLCDCFSVLLASPI